ncbi:response regulator [Bradyrhizobium sp. MOS001]|uniref:response regulator n=1 Tax=Bradyrhizobium sp. MOS001 TaxID=2133948 RepID=UPI0010754025|nr:response regulator [Bradyrhizobium sp. MOS001]TFW56697.1 response regulator [Bradyrhizobium sp. MOS001]
MIRISVFGGFNKGLSMTNGSPIKSLDRIGNLNESVNDLAIENTAEALIGFNRFHVLPHSRQLFADGIPVEIGGRAFDLLLALLNSNGNLVTKEELVARAWPNTIVSESNLRVQIAALRNALGGDKGIVKSISGRGYTFTAPISTREAAWGSSATFVGDHYKVGLPHQSLAACPTISRYEGRSAVAIIDDDPDIRKAIRGLLQSIGLRAEVFSSTGDFLQSSSAIGCRCLLLDVRLPGRSGLDFYDDLVRAGVHLPVIFMSGCTDPPVSTRAINAGAVKFLSKPVRHKDLLDAIRLAMKNDTHERP